MGGFFDSLLHVLRSKTTRRVASEVVPFIPGGSAMLDTLDKVQTIIHDAKEGDPAAIQTVKEIKARSVLGDPIAKEAVKTMAVVSKAQDIKTAKNKSFYARGIAVGHDPVHVVGATRRHSSSSSIAPSTSAARVTDWRGGKPVTYYTPPPSGAASPYTQWGMKPVAPPPIIGPSAPIRTKLPPMPVEPPPQQIDPYADPYSQYGQPQYPGVPGYPPYPQYPGAPGYDPFGGYGMYDPYQMMPGYPLPGMPYGYGYEEPIIDRGGFQQYDPATDSFFSSNQKQVYDEATGMFYPVSEYNPYAG